MGDIRMKTLQTLMTLKTWVTMLLLLIATAGSEALAATYTYTYQVVDLSGGFATKAQVTAEEGTSPTLPLAIQTNLVTGYHYYTSDQFNISGSTYTLKVGATEVDELPASNTTIYVTYDYDNSTSSLDLSGSTIYYIEDSSGGSAHYLCYINGWNSADWRTVGSSDGSNFDTNDSRRQWQFVGNDPYRIYVRNVYYNAATGGNGYLRSDLGSGSGLSDNVNIRYGGMSVNNLFNTFFFDKDNNMVAANNVWDMSGSTNRYIYLYKRGKTSYGDVGAAFYVTGSNNLDLSTLHLSCPRPLTYHIVNSEGVTVERVVTNITVAGAPSLPDRSRLQRAGCTLSTKYYSDAACTEEIATVTPGVTTDVYVPYTFDAAALKAATGMVFSTEEDPVWFNMQVGNSLRNIVYNTSTTQLPTETAYTTISQKQAANAQWAFIGDPYSMKIINRANTTKYAYTPFGSNGSTVYMRDYEADHSLWCARTGTASAKIQIKVQGWGTADYPAYWNATGGSGGIQLYNGNSTDYTGADNNITLTPCNYYTFHVVRADGTVAIARYESVDVAATSIAMPVLLRTPYITDDSDYKFFDTQEHAAAYSATGVTTGGRTLYSEVVESDRDIYVGYRWNGTVPEGLPHLDGSTLHHIKTRSANYYYFNAADINGVNAVLWNATESIENEYLWYFTGNDPYSIYVNNRGARISQGDVSDYGLRIGNYWSAYTWCYSGISSGAPSRHTIVGSGAYFNLLTLSTTSGAALGTADYVRAIYGNGGRTYYSKEEYVATGVTQQLTFPTVCIADFTFHVPTRVSGRDITVRKTLEVTDDAMALPAELERKYISGYTYYTSYDASEENYDDRFSGEVTTLEDVVEAGQTDIYVKYTVDETSMPFEPGTDFNHATWYRIKVVDYDRYAHLSESAQVAGEDDTYTSDYRYAFFGDPYELKVMNRAGGEGMYIGVPSGSAIQTAVMPIANGTALNTWECFPDGLDDDEFMLRVFGTVSTPRYCGFSNGKACYFTTAITMTLEPMPERTYTYNIVDNSGRIAIKKTVSQPIGTPILVENLPSEIVSPYILDETVTGYTITRNSTQKEGRQSYSLSGTITETPVTGAEIYIRYTTEKLLDKALRLNGRRSYNVYEVRSGLYAYYDAGSASKIGFENTDGNLRSQTRIWSLLGSDPYDVKLQNLAYRVNGSDEEQYFSLRFTGSIPPVSFSLESVPSAAPVESYPSFILMEGSAAGNAQQVTFVAATGEEPSAGEELRFSSDLPVVTYHIVDKQDKIVITGTSASSDLEVPAHISSPLVEEYHYWKLSDFSVDGDEYTLTGSAEITSVSEALYEDEIHIYVTYDVNDDVDYDTTDDNTRDTDVKMYLLKFSGGETFYQEDGKDALMTTAQKAVYPYSNGDANLYIYGQEQWEKQLESGASTRNRWPWYVVSANRDPYHVKIQSYQSQGKTTSYNYFYTHVENFGGANHVVTGVTTMGDRVVTGGTIGGVNYGSHPQPATEYMVLGTRGRNKLVTVAEIAAEGVAEDATYGKHRVVNTFEQYWKNNPTVRDILNVADKGVGSQPVTYELSAAQRALLEEKGWHTYASWANAAPWSDTSTGGKDYLWGNHWFQTIDMGESGEFAFEEVSLTAVLVLLDQHGWEIMRTTLPSGPTATNKEALYKEIRKYHSPLVSRYHYWKTGSKIPGYHKFNVSDYAADAVTGGEYTTKVLGEYNSETGSGNLPDWVANGSVARDWYVTYDVKSDFADIYRGAAAESAVRASAFIIKQGGEYAKTTDGTSVTTATTYDGTDGMLWYVQPNFNIDKEMGYLYTGETGALEDAGTKAENEAQYYADGKNGFDPYNVQIRSKAYDDRYFTTNATAAALNTSGGWQGTGSTAITLEEISKKIAKVSGHDQVSLNVTNATFIIVSDENGNMRLMPRFDHGVVMDNMTTLSTQDEAEPVDDEDGDQTLLLGKPTVYTYHVINRSGREAITWVDNFTEIGEYRPAERFPDKLKAYGATNFRYLPLSEFDGESLSHGTYTLVNPKVASYETFSSYGSTGDIYVVYDLNTSAIREKGFDGYRIFNVKLQKTSETAMYMTYASSTLGSVATLSTEDEKRNLDNVWILEGNGGDPYDVSVYPYRLSGTSLLDKKYIICVCDTSNADNKLKKYELMATGSRADGNIYTYLTFNGDDIALVNSGARQHGTLVSFVTEPVTLTFTYKLYDLSGNLTLQVTYDNVNDLVPTVPDMMRSPLVRTYYYYKDEDQVEELSSLSQAVGNTVYVGYQPYTLDEAVLRLDGSERYTLFRKDYPSQIYSPADAAYRLINSTQEIKYRPENYTLQLQGRQISGQYDPYDVAVYIPRSNQYWSCNITEINSNTDISLQSYANPDRFMILEGQDGCVEIMHKKFKKGTYYNTAPTDYTAPTDTHYAYLTSILASDYQKLCTRQGSQGNAWKNMHGTDAVQFKLQPYYTYHILNLKGTEAVAAIHGTMVEEKETEPALTPLFRSPLIKEDGFQYYDVTAFNITSDGVMTLRAGATPLEFVSDATTTDIYVVYSKKDIKDDIDLTGAVAYNMTFQPDRGYTAYYDQSAAVGRNNIKSKRRVASDSPKDGELLDVADLTTLPYLWQLKGSDPYDLKLYNALLPGVYFTASGEASNYQRPMEDKTTGECNTLILLSSGAGEESAAYGNGYRYRLMFTHLETGDITRYMYLGKNYRYSQGYGGARNDGSFEIVKCNYNDGWGDAVQWPDGDFAYLKLDPQQTTLVTYVVVNASGNEAIEYKETASMGLVPEIPVAIRSPYAKNFRYWSDAACTVEMEAIPVTSPAANVTIYVTYDRDDDALAGADIDLSGSLTYNVQVNGTYFYYNAGRISIDNAPQKYDDVIHEWYLSGNDPYDVRLSSMAQTAQHMELATYDNDADVTMLTRTVTHSDSNDLPSFILMDGQPGRFELLGATSTKTNAATRGDTYIKNRLMYLGFAATPGLLGVGSDDDHPIYQSGMNEVQVRLRRPPLGVTYHIMNLSGKEAVQYTVDGNIGDELEVPEVIRSPFATNWRYWSDEECTVALSEVSDAGTHIYVTYTYNDDTDGILRIDGARYYNMRVADWYIEESNGAIDAFYLSNMSSNEANVLEYLWAFDGTTDNGVDPYAMHLVSMSDEGIYAGAPMTYGVDTEGTLHMSDGMEDNFRSTFFLVEGATEDTYEMVLASGSNITNNVLAYVSRMSGSVVNVTRDEDMQHGAAALSVKLTSPVNRYLYKVYDRSNHLAIQAWGDGVAGGQPEIPSVIKSPLVSKFYYNVETLPYTTGEEEVRVTYDVDDENLELVPNLVGTKFYNIKFRNSYYLQTDGTDVDVTQDTSNDYLPASPTTPTAGNAYVWTPTANMGDGRIDPYAVTLMHDDDGVIYTTSIADGRNEVNFGESGAYQTFILLNGTEGNYQFMAATGDALESTPEQNRFGYLGITSDNTLSLLIGHAYTQDRTSIQVELRPFQYTYTYVIIDNDMYEVIRNAVVADAGDPVMLTKGLRSPLLDYGDYEFYSAGAFTTIGTYLKNVGESTAYVFDNDAKEANRLTTLPYEDHTIYVRYSYSRKAGSLDISGESKYQIMNRQDGRENYIYASSNLTNHNIWNDNSASANHTRDIYLWRLNGNDPYNVYITNVGHANDDVLMATELWYQNGTGGNWQSRDQGLSVWPEGYSEGTTAGKYKATRFAILAHDDGEYRMMAITPFFWDPTYYDLTDSQRSVESNLRQERYYTVDGRWSIYRHGRVNNTVEQMTTETGLQICFNPVTTHNYRFHLTTKIDGRNIVVEKPGTMARDLFKLPEELRRKYCTYTVKYYVDQDDNAATQNPVTRDTEGAVEKVLDVSDPTTLYPFFKTIDDMPENTEVEKAAKAAKWVDIYVDYTVDDAAIPFTRMTSTAERTRMLFDNAAILETAFDLTSYEKMNEPIPWTGVKRKDYLYFMVMKTDNDFSNANGQYFLRREDNGRISYLNNDFRLHYKAADNYRGWDYSRLAEYYRENDHDPFQEKRWLWCFAGDPYDLYVFNLSSVLQEKFDNITGNTNFSTHRDHLTGYTTQTNKAGTTTEQVVSTPDYGETAVMYYRWGIAEGQGANSDETFSFITGEFTEDADNYINPTIPNEGGSPLYWSMDKSQVDGKIEVMLRARAETNTTLDYNIQVLPYEPHQYEDVRIVVRRDDAVESYLSEYPTPVGEIDDPVAARAQTTAIDNLPTGTIRMYSSSDDREYAVGDVVSVDELPRDIVRKFCDYTGYSDDYRTEGNLTITESNVAYRGEVQRYSDGPMKGNIIYNSVGKPMYNYYKVKKTGPAATDTIHVPSSPLTEYVKYEVTTDMFLKNHPTQAEVETMTANNDHVYFMDFADTKLLKGQEMGYNTGHHAYFDDERTFESQIPELHEGVLAEKMVWNGNEFVYDTSQPYNYAHFQTTDNRMETVPEKLKWYFVGDPYNLQVYCTDDEFNQTSVVVDGETKAPGEVGTNLCRFDPTESSFQFVVDCVHFRTPDESFIDERNVIYYRDEDGNTVAVDNPNEGKPYYPNFYWEVVSTTTDDEDAFALRFHADNNLLGYRDVYYYLAHNGLRRTYRDETSENPKGYYINLSYDKDNERYLTGKYMGYHKSNDEKCAIRLVQPVKLYVSAYKNTYSGNPVTQEELSEYYGVGETLTEVPRHLQRKYVTYGNLQYQKNGSAVWNDATDFPFTLEKTSEKAFNIEKCTAHDANVFVDDTTSRVSYKLRVTYDVDDETKDGIHLFTTQAEFANADMEPQWLDITVGGNHWLYYDKTNLDGSGVENDTLRVSDFPVSGKSGTQSGWDTGLKGLHWAMVGDPYKFTLVNRRRWEDLRERRVANDDYNFWLGTSYGQHNQQEDDGTGTKSNLWYNYLKLGSTNENRDYGSNGLGGNDENGNTEWSLQMCKTGGDGDYFIRTASPKEEVIDALVGDYSNSHEPSNLTNDYARVTYRPFTNLNGSAVPAQSSYVLEEFSLETETNDIQKAVIRTVVAEDEDGADNDCFDANVRIYDKDGELKATLKYVEVTYGDVFESLPYTLRRFGCTYTDCYQLYYTSYTNAMMQDPTGSSATAYTATLNEKLQRIGNFTGDDRVSFVTAKRKDSAFSDESIDYTKLITDINGRKYIELAYVYHVDEDVAQFFTSEDDAKQEEYNWSNAFYEWEQTYTGSNLRIVELVDVFDHYVYNADGHIIDEVYRKEESITYPPGTSYSTQMQGWMNSHNDSQQEYGDERTQSEDNRQKWSLVGDPYDFEMKNYQQYLGNNSSALMVTETSEGAQVKSSNVDKSHWAIVQGDQKTTKENGKTVKVTDENGNPVYEYYLALIDDDETSATYGSAVRYVTFDRASGNKDLKADDQYLYLYGGPTTTTDPTGNLYDAEGVKGFRLSDLLSYANMVVYHLIIAHQYSTDYENADADLGETADQQTAAKNTIRKHLAEYLHYKMQNASFDATYLEESSDFNYRDEDSYMTWDFKSSYQSGGKATGLPASTIEKMRKGTLRDLVNDPVENSMSQRVGIGNKLNVPWYMKRQFCKYTLYQRDVLRSVTLNGENGTTLTYAYLKNDAGEYVDTEGNVVSESERIQLFLDEAKTQPAYEIAWISVRDKSTWSTWTDDDDESEKYTVTAADVSEWGNGLVAGQLRKIPSGYASVVATNGTNITMLSEVHKNRMVLVDVVYETDQDKFRFADEGRETTAWYQLLTLEDDDVLAHFDYTHDVSLGRDRSVHYTNDYLWAPEGDAYGFVMHNRYATNNGTGWAAVIPTTDNAVFDEEIATPWMTTDEFNAKNVVQDDETTHNAVYEMLSGMNERSFLMHPTRATLDASDDSFKSFYMKDNHETHQAELTYAEDAKVLSNNDKSANWILMATPEQLMPYFDRAGYVGGLTPDVAGTFANRSLYATLQNYAANYRADASVVDFRTMDRVRALVYSGAFANGEAVLPQKFTGNNLVPLQLGYWRIQAFSRAALDNDDANIEGTDLAGIQGPRYVSGYRHQSEADYKGYVDNTLTAGAQPLHFYETDEAHATVKTFGILRTLIDNLDSRSVTTRGMAEHPALRGNIELLPVEYDPSSIFYLQPAVGNYSLYTLSTQGLNVQGTAGAGEAGSTSLSTSAGTEWHMQDIGGATVTMQTLATSGVTAANVESNLQTGYMSIDDNHRFCVTVHTANEMEETGDSYEEWTKDGARYAVQSTKWMLQPVGVENEWPYNELPLSVRVNKGDHKPNPVNGTGLSGATNVDNNYYASLYVPFDTRLDKTIDGAFTSTVTSPEQYTIRLSSVSQLNNMGNPQFIPAEWPVILRTGQPVTASSSLTDDGNVIPSSAHVNLYLPNQTPTVIADNRSNITLCGSYLEKELTDAEIDSKTGKVVWTNGRNVMVFGLPFVEEGVSGNDKTEMSSVAGEHGSLDYYAYEEGSAVGFFTNENWRRDNVAATNTALSEDDGTLATSFLATARDATYAQRDNKYVYHNKVYYVYDYNGRTAAPNARPVLTRSGYAALFDDMAEELEEETLEPDKQDAVNVRWGVFDLSGRQIRTREAVLNGTWRRNLVPGMYIVNGRKLLIKK